MKYAFIRRHRGVWPIGIQCGVLKVSVSGYHEHFARQLQITERRHLSAEALAVHVRAVYQENRAHTGGRVSGVNCWHKACVWVSSGFSG